MFKSAGSGFWGKYISETGKSLSLLAHALDVATVFRALCEVDAVRRSLASSTKTELTNEHLDRLAVLTMLHDIGKANLGFQDKILPGQLGHVGHIQELAPLFGDEGLRTRFFKSLPPGTKTWFSNSDSADSYFFAIFSHHGRPVEFPERRTGHYWQARNKWWQPDQSRDPIQAIAEISSFAVKAFPGAFLPSAGLLPAEPRFHHRFAGLVMLADWLGSHDYWFPVQEVTAEERLKHNQKIAPELLKAVGLDAKPLRKPLKQVGDKFKSFFEFTPRPLQSILDEVDPHNFNTRLLVVESETGSGKTEAALNWFRKLFVAGKVDSLYFALPTRVAARELYSRINNYVSSWFPNSDCRPVTLLAVPGYAQVDGYSVKELLPEGKKANLWQEDQKSLTLERHWAGAMPKRFLAATIAVGTIDQALLSIVQTAHAHLRSVCLDRSLLVVDEVHASDLYMSRLLCFLLAHHLGVGGTAMLLSATLGSRALNDYIQITRPEQALSSFSAAVKKPYPALTFSDGRVAAAGATERPKEVHFETHDWAFSPENAVDQILAPALRVGARVLVVMNTVARALAMQRAVEASDAIDEAWLFKCRKKICPHHGRFAPADREILDQAVSARFGKKSPPGPVLVVGTQTLEQSLDIDCDLLLTDLAPCDVLLQRVGRLHRHLRRRPTGYTGARCIVLVPDQPLESALGTRGEVSGDFKRLGYGSVYEDLRSLELTYRTIKEYPRVTVPADNRLLVEKATHPEALNGLIGGYWEEHGNLLHGKGLAKKIAADTITGLYDQYFGKQKFVEVGRAVSTRLGIDRLHLMLSHPVTSPFGRSLTAMVIPGNMAPEEIDDEVVAVERETREEIILRYQDYRYRYSRQGLEEMV